MARRIGPIAIVVDEKSIARADKRLERYQGRYLHERAKKAYLEGARLGVRPIRAWTPAKSGNLRRSVKAQNVRTRAGEMAAATVGPRAPHRHLITRGHRIVTPGKRDTGRRTTPNPFVDEAFNAYGQAALDFINARVLDIGGLTTNTTGTLSGYSPL